MVIFQSEKINRECELKLTMRNLIDIFSQKFPHDSCKYKIIFCDFLLHEHVSSRQSTSIIQQRSLCGHPALQWREPLNCRPLLFIYPSVSWYVNCMARSSRKLLSSSVLLANPKSREAFSATINFPVMLNSPEIQ